MTPARIPAHIPPAQPLDRKQREREQRERMYLSRARSILLERGYLGLTMDRIAEGSGYSKGTLYQHFANKEEVVVALGVRIARVQLELFERAATFRGRPRERIVAIGMAYRKWALEYPDDIRVTQIIKHRSLRSKVSEPLKLKLEACEEGCSGVISNVVTDAVECGDLQLPQGLQPGHIGFGLWALSWGSYTLTLMDFDLTKLEVDDSLELLDRHCHALLDGYGWLPLFAEWNWDATEERIERECFHDWRPATAAH